MSLLNHYLRWPTGGEGRYNLPSWSCYGWSPCTMSEPSKLKVEHMMPEVFHADDRCWVSAYSFGKVLAICMCFLMVCTVYRNMMYYITDVRHMTYCSCSLWDMTHKMENSIKFISDIFQKSYMIDIHISAWKPPHITFVPNKLLSSGLHQIVLGGSSYMGTVCRW